MAASSKSEKIYDVFLSFRGTDLRNNFVGHLYQALHLIGIYTFRDSEELKKGDQISPTLMKAIEESCISIIVFSENYASSTWCLEEVSKIMECNEQKNLTVLPVFYKVDPREVRGGRKSYRRALAKHESKFGKDSEKVKRWKKALSDAGSLSGWHLKDGDESELIQEIVEKISTYLARTPLHVAKHPVGIDSRVVKLKSMLNLESDDGVLMVGLWGQGGIGKTSLAKALYNAMFRQFEGSCFLANVRETSKGSGGLVTLQEILLNDILSPQQRLVVSNVDGGIHLIKRRLGRKKVFLILDDVDDRCQLNTLAGEKWFGNGSRIIITTRDKHLLTCHQIDQDHVYEVKALDDNQAHELLSKHAFQMHQIRADLVDRALDYAKGLPLALEVLGSLLCGTKEDVWESTLTKLSRIPDRTINNVLKVSYDGLHENEKDIFLHIACFFNGWAREYTKKVLDACDLQTVAGFDILMKRSLISIECEILNMHDLIQAMGIDIVNQECRDDPGRRSRLWLYDDVVDVLSRDMGDCAIKAIVLALPEQTEMCIGPDAFTKMRRLRLLILRNVHDSFQGPICLPNELRWFEWPGCAGRIPEFSSGPKKLVGLDMSEGNITRIIKQFKELQNLKYINLSFCDSLVSMPDLLCTPNLEELALQYCKNLVEAHQSIAHHEKLRVLTLEGCSKLSVFPNVLKSKNLQRLDLKDCGNFERFPDIPHKLESLKSLCLQGTAIKELPASIENLVSLERMMLHNCKNLVSLPSSIYKLQNMERLILNDCTTLIGFPKYEDSADASMKMGLPSLKYLDLEGCNLSEVEFLGNLSCFPILRRLILSRNNITSLPTSFGKRNHLFRLAVQDCYQLQEIPQLPPFLDDLWAPNCESLQKTGNLISSQDFVRRRLTMVSNFTPGENNCKPSIYLLREGMSTCSRSFHIPGGEMPEWLQPVEEEFVSFMASEDLYNKFLALAICFVVSKTKERGEIRIERYVNGQLRRNGYDGWATNSLDMDHIVLLLHPPSTTFGEVDFSQIDGSFVQFRLTISGTIVKKWGFRIICKQLEDDLKVGIQDNQLIDPALLYEVGHDSTNSEAESSHMHKVNPIEIDLQKDLQDCQMSTEEHSQAISERNHELFSHEACEPRPCGLLIRLAEMSMAVFARCFCC
ncbi:disease resistance protein Roq1-like isoform X1 [Syzygium oleosum]|uniref:disease resistance protein Roq1-like isoform X1 n=2 Tax=Syzygium oleosum TaxID=219896 RepID=UPI0024BAA63A|nr:disease resistance protein Roq1-like isoform X1 [Syzygium oleosum]XP_056158535.1 disease resistance protein Roq1-like isoform X1 [Syzygium oleosum]XP_056158536.1 disease resistance protein Roq1-like isoform X1 [Syzygium oleosum]XP_056158537.1 disease resistance protein Roq1-like isoform X1 [Syzygium oleosum]XP_056158538.1 disease resistance protein Roq1-like isoform X1 [Syzygium oleosum]XP_056158539.1 disease resistance protein Roq1-like isoform X1 [Syzygium oleosum]XP_056158540.1 disease 